MLTEGKYRHKPKVFDNRRPTKPPPMTVHDSFFIDLDGWVVVMDPHHGQSVRLRKATEEDIEAYRQQMKFVEEEKLDVLKQHIKDTASDLISDFLFYDRKEDDDLPVGAIEDAIDHGIITVDEIMDIFRKNLEKSTEE